MIETKESILKLIADQKWSEALHALKASCESNPDTLWAWQLTAQSALRLKIWPLAQQASQQIIRLKPGQTDAYINLSQLYLMQGQVSQAVNTYLKALKQCSDIQELVPALKKFMDSDRFKQGLSSLNTSLFQTLLRYFCQRHMKTDSEYCLKQLSQVLEHNHSLTWALEQRAFLYMQTQQLQLAIVDLKTLLSLSPGAQIWHNLGVAQIKNIEFDQACKSLSEALKIDPLFEPAQIELVQVLLNKKDYLLALEHLSQPLLPALSRPVFESAQILLNRGNYCLANQYFELCQTQLKSLPVTAGSFFLLRASCAHFLADCDLSEQMLQKAHSEGIHDLVIEQQRLLAVPYAYRNKKEALEIDQQFDFKWHKFKRKADKAFNSDKLDLKSFSPQPPFLLAYLRRNMLPIMKDMSGFWHDIYQKKGLKLTCQHVPNKQTKLRIGFVSRFFYNHSVLLCYGGSIANIAQHPGSSVSVFHLGSKFDDQTAWLKDQVDHFFHLDESSDIAAKILDEQVDVLIYTDIGMDALTYRLAMHRLAPIQMVLLGHPVTTGLPDIDYVVYYAHNKTLEELEHEHTEHLICLPASLNTERRQPTLEKPALTRGELGLGESEHVYFCPMTLYKIHPDYDDLLAGILKKDPQGHIYMARYHESPYHEILHQRFRDSYPDLAERLHFLPWMNQHHFYSMIKASDLILDNLYFAGGTTIRIVLGLAVPFLTLPGKYIREYMAAGIYNKLNFYDLCASSPEDYVNKAVYIATHPEYRAELVQKIIDLQKALFPQEDGTLCLIKILKYLIAQYPQKGIPADLLQKNSSYLTES